MGSTSTSASSTAQDIVHMTPRSEPSTSSTNTTQSSSPLFPTNPPKPSTSTTQPTSSVSPETRSSPKPTSILEVPTSPRLFPVTETTSISRTTKLRSMTTTQNRGLVVWALNAKWLSLISTLAMLLVVIGWWCFGAKNKGALEEEEDRLVDW